MKKPAQDKPAGKVKLTKARRGILCQLLRVGMSLVWYNDNFGAGLRQGSYLYNGRGIQFMAPIVSVRFLIKRKLVSVVYRESRRHREYRITPLGRRALRESSK